MFIEGVTFSEEEEKERLTWFYWEVIAEKLLLIRRVKTRVAALLDDFLWNEVFWSYSSTYTQSRRDSLEKVMSFLQIKTVEEILWILDSDELDTLKWSEEHRLYMLKVIS